jgi:ribosomal protein L18
MNDQHDTIRRGLAVLAALALSLGTWSAAGADEPPPDDPPPPAEEPAPPPPPDTTAPDTPAEEPAPPAEKPAPPPPDAKPMPEEPAPPVETTPDWSRPATPTGGQGGGATPPAPVEERYREWAHPPLDPGPDRVRRPAPAPARLTGNEVLRVAKTHNLPMGDGDLALQLDVDYRLVGQANRDVYVQVWFARKATGRAIVSTMPQHGDNTGQATVQTRAARVTGADMRYRATLKIPYRVFPVAARGEEYDVQARVQVLRREARNMVSVLARGETTFRVYGAPAETALPTPPPAPVPGAAEADEMGGIETPGDATEMLPGRTDLDR